MSFPVFKDFDKDPADLMNDDFDAKYTLKIKSAGPADTTITTNVQYASKDGKASLKPKVSLKWPHASGFTLEKFEFAPDCKMTVETSLKNTLPGLKLEFKGNDADKADLSFEYSIPNAKFAGEFDMNNLSKGEASVSSGYEAFTGGLSAKFSSGKDDKAVKVALGLGLAHNVPKVCFMAARAKDNFSAFSLLFSYTQLKDVDIAGSVDYSSKASLATLVAKYKVDSTTTFKAKATTDGVVSASLKKAFEKKFAVVGSVEVPSDLKTVKWGLNATLG